MTNIEKYNNAFVEVFGVESAVLDDGFSKDSVDAWDSVHQLNIIAYWKSLWILCLTRKISWNLPHMVKDVRS